MEAYNPALHTHGGERTSETQSVFLGPAWLIACGLGGILGGFFMRGTSFSWPLMMLGAGVGLVGAAMLYRNIVRSRRRSDELAAAAAAGGGGPFPDGVLPLAAIRIPLAFAAALNQPLTGAAGSPGPGPGPGQGPPMYVVVLDKAATTSTSCSTGPPQHQIKVSEGTQPDGRSPSRCGSCVGPGRPAGSSLLGPDAIALAVPLRAPLPRWPPAATGEGSSGGSPRGGEEVESGSTFGTGGLPDGREATEGQGHPPLRRGNAKGRRREQQHQQRSAAEEEEADDEGREVVAGAGGFALVLQPQPQLLGFTAHILRELQQQQHQRSHQHQQQSQQQQRQEVDLSAIARQPAPRSASFRTMEQQAPAVVR